MLRTSPRRPLYYGAIALIPQIALAQEPSPAPEPEQPRLAVLVRGEFCGPAGISLRGEPGALELVAPDGRVVLTGADLAVIEGWLSRCPKGEGAK